MARTFIRQDAQIASTLDSIVGFVDSITPSAAMESGAATIADDLNNIRSVLHTLLKRRTGNWYDDLAIPTTFTGEGEAQRAVDDLNADLHNLERKRFLRRVRNAVDVTVGTGNNFVVLSTGELPSNTTAAVGAVTTLGTVAAAHTGTFGTHALDLVSGNGALNPRNLVDIVDGTTGDIITSSGRTVYALLQTENPSDGHTISDTTPNRAQLSFVRPNATFDGLEAVPFADIENKTINYTVRERLGFDDLNEQDLLSDTIADVPAGVVVDRQTAYDNQGTTPVNLTTSATLDLEGPGLVWSIRDDLEASLLSVTEGSATSTSTVALGTDVDLFDNNAASNDFAAGATLNSGGTRPLAIGVTDGVIESTAGDIRINGAVEMFLDDGNQPVSWTQTDGVKLSEQASDWTTWSTNFGGEVSIMEAINSTYALAFAGGTRTKVQAVVTNGNQAAGTDINGPGTPHNNTDVNLAAYDAVSFLNDVEVFLNGELLRNDATSGGTGDVYPGGTPTDGDLRFNFALRGTGAKPDQLTVIVNGQ